MVPAVSVNPGYTVPPITRPSGYLKTKQRKRCVIDDNYTSYAAAVTILGMSLDRIPSSIIEPVPKVVNSILCKKLKRKNE